MKLIRITLIFVMTILIVFSSIIIINPLRWPVCSIEKYLSKQIPDGTKLEKIEDLAQQNKWKICGLNNYTNLQGCKIIYHKDQCSFLNGLEVIKDNKKYCLVNENYIKIDQHKVCQKMGGLIFQTENKKSYCINGKSLRGTLGKYLTFIIPIPIITIVQVELNFNENKELINLSIYKSFEGM